MCENSSISSMLSSTECAPDLQRSPLVLVEVNYKEGAVGRNVLMRQRVKSWCEDTERSEPPSAVGRIRLLLENRQTRVADSSAVLSPWGRGDFQTACLRLSCSTGGGSNVGQEMMEELWSFPADSPGLRELGSSWGRRVANSAWAVRSS